jgi:DNA invertase Pin-like site-specific DNA recombinase
MKPKRVAIYIRVSTGHQDYEMQKTDLTALCEFRKWTVVETYADKMSGTKDKGPSLDRMMADAKKERFDVVVVWKYDRFARSTRHLLAALEEFKELGIDFVSLNDGADTTTASGKLLFTIIAGFAEFELSVRRERCEAGIRRAQKNGTRSGRPFGRPEVEVDPAAIADLRQKGLSWRAVAAQLGINKDTAIRHASEA